MNLNLAPYPTDVCPLLQETVRLLKETAEDLPTIATKTGLNFYWIQSLRYNRRIDPSVTKVVTLYEYLAGKKLEF